MTVPGPEGEGCAGHSALGEELRIIAELLGQRIATWSQRPEQTGAASGPCSWCPICAVVTLARGQRPELAARLGLHAAGLLAVLRESLAPEEAAAPGGGAAPDPGTTPRDSQRVQRVTVRRPGSVGSESGPDR